MQPLQRVTTREALPAVCADELLAAVPAVMRFIRQEMRRNRPAGLTVPQFRALIFLSHDDDPSVSAMAEHLGLSLPAVSRMVQLLVKRGLMERQASPADRRRVSLSLTRQGRRTFQLAFDATRAALAAAFTNLPRAELAGTISAMQVLNRLFATGDAKPSAGQPHQGAPQ